MSFRSTIKQLREQKGASQADVAEAIGIARATYASLEADRRPPNLDEIHKLAEYYQISPADLISGGANVVNEPVAPYQFSKTTKHDIPRGINPKTDPEKLRQVLLYVLEKVGAKPNVGEAVLHKLLYFIDFGYYAKTGHSITGLTYVRNHFGPTPAPDFMGVVEGMKVAEDLEIVETKHFKNIHKKYLPLTSATLDSLSGNELRHIDETLARLADKPLAELRMLAQSEAPWHAAADGEMLIYDDIQIQPGTPTAS